MKKLFVAAPAAVPLVLALAAPVRADDALKTAFFAETTSKIVVVADNGRFFTLDASKLPGGRGFGDPIRLMVDLEEGADFISAFPYRAGTKLLVVGTDGRVIPGLYAGWHTAGGACGENSYVGDPILGSLMGDVGLAFCGGYLCATSAVEHEMVGA